MKSTKTRFLTVFAILFIVAAYHAAAQDYAHSLASPGGGLLNKIANSPKNNAIFCSVWGDGLYKSTNKGAIWSKVSSGLTSAFINDILFDANGEGYVATQGGGVFKTTNDGASWTAVNNGVTNLNATALAFGPNNILLLGTAGSGMFVSTDKGATWTNSRVGISYQDIKTIAVAHNGFILAGTYGGGIFLSRDTCKTWKANNSGLRNLFINQIVVAKNSNMYVATNGEGVFQSGNNGTYWTAYDSATLEDKDVTCLYFTHQNELIAGTRSTGVYLHDDSVLFKWKKVVEFDEGILSITRDNGGIIYYTNLENKWNYSDEVGRRFKDGGRITSALDKVTIGALNGGAVIVKYSQKDVFSSTDYGATWTNGGQATLAANAFAIDSTGGEYMATNTGIYYSSDKGATWTLAGLSDTEIRDVEISPTNEIFITTFKSNGDGTPPPPPDIRIYSSTDHQNWNIVKTYTQYGVNQLSIAKSGEIVVILHQKLVEISRDNGASWQTVPGLIEPIYDIQFSQPNHLWASSGNKLYHSTNFGTSWETSILGFKPTMGIKIPNFTVTPQGMPYVAVQYTRKNNTRYDLRRSEDLSQWDSLWRGYSLAEIRAVESDPEGNVYFARNNIMRIINKDALRAPAWQYPTHMAEGLDSIVAFKWKSARLTQLYEMQLSKSADFDFIDDEVVTSDTLYATALPLELGTRYFARVRSRANDQYGPWSVIEFMTKLGGPILVSPLKNSAGIYYTTDLLWEAVEAADYYRIEVSEKSDFSSLAYSVDSTNKLTVKTSILKPNTVYYWRVKALTKTNSSEWSEVWNFRTTLAAPILVSPAKNTQDHDKTVLLKWRKVDGAPSYDVEVSKTSDFAAPVETKTAVTDTTVTITGLEYNTTYFWRVSAGVTPIVGDWSEVWSFTTGIEPPTLLTPANNAAGLDPAVHFAWDFALTGAYKYEIQIDTATTFLSSPRPVTAKTYDTTGLPRSSKYFWRVRATLGAQKGFWSEAWSFSTKLGAPTLVYPANQSQNLALRIMSKWNQIKAAEFYFVQLAKDTLFTELVYSRDSVYATGFEFKDLEPNTKYFWRVRSANAASPSEWSEIWSFTTGANVPALLKPDDGAENQPVNLTLMWADIMGVPAFHVQVARDEQFANMYREEPEVAGSTLALTDLPKESKFFWRARSVNPSGASPWSEVRSFTTGKGGSAYESNAIAARISPNPASSELNAEFEISRPGQARIYILDALGRVALDLGERELASGRVSATFNISVLPSGSYRLIIVSGSDARAVAFIKID